MLNGNAAFLFARRPAAPERTAGCPGGEAVAPLLACLSAREVEIARFVADGLSNKEIGQALRISHHTVSTHLRRIFTKLDLNCRIELCRVVLADVRTPAAATAGRLG